MRPVLHRTLALLLLTAPLAVDAQQSTNPYDSNPAAQRAGRALFANRCAECHGADARGFSGPDLTVLWAEGTSDGRVFQTIRSGVSGSIMPSFSASDQEIWAMVAYMKSISTVPAFDNARGDAGRGQELFSSTCTRCHRIGGDGGRLGPDLSRIAAIRSRDTLIRSIRDPSGSVASGYRTVTVVTRDSQRIRGVVKSEDAFSIQILDTGERLRGYVKADVQGVIHEDRSLMRQFGPDRLSEDQLDDLLQYLGTLRG